MTRFVHDQFAKQYLEELLTPLDKVKTSAAYSGEFTLSLLQLSCED